MWPLAEIAFHQIGSDFAFHRFVGYQSIGSYGIYIELLSTFRMLVFHVQSYFCLFLTLWCHLGWLGSGWAGNRGGISTTFAVTEPARLGSFCSCLCYVRVFFYIWTSCRNCYPSFRVCLFFCLLTNHEIIRNWCTWITWNDICDIAGSKANTLKLSSLDLDEDVSPTSRPCVLPDHFIRVWMT